MVETNNSGLGIRGGATSPNTQTTIAVAAQTNSAYLTTAMLLGTQGCGYLGQRIQNRLRERSEIEQHHNYHHQQQQQHQHQHQHQQRINNNNQSITNGSNTSMATSLFTIDSILASNKTNPVSSTSMHNLSPSADGLIKIESPSNSPPLPHQAPNSSSSSPVRPTRVPAMLHPGLHLGHLAAAAASGFGSPSDFLGIYLCVRTF